MSAIVVTGGGPLNVSGTAIFDAGGTAELELGPVPPSTVWSITRMTVSTTGPTDPMPSCAVYDGPAHPSRLIDATWTGAQDVSDFGTPYVLEASESLTFRWTGGTPGEQATARLIGRQQVV